MTWDKTLVSNAAPHWDGSQPVQMQMTDQPPTNHTMKTKTLYTELQRKLRVTNRNIDTFSEHMDVVTEYREAFDQWNLPFKEWHSFSYVNKNQYMPWRKFSIILKRWSATDKFEY